MKRILLDSFKSQVLRLATTNYYPLTDAVGSGSVIDATGSGHNGTPNSGVTLGQAGFIAGEVGTAALFDGSTGSISLPTSGLPTGSNPWTVFCLCRMASVPSGGDQFRPLLQAGAFSGNEGFIFYYDASAHQFGYGPVSGSNVTGGATPTNGSQHMVACSFDGTAGAQAIKLYVDGSRVAQGASGSSLLNLTYGSATIGADTVGDFFPGEIGHVGIVSSVLTADQIAALWRYSLRGQIFRKEL